jgi:NitT/TauT family transport system substrate-binding protein
LPLSDAGTYKTTIVVVGHHDFLKGHAPAIEKLVRALLKAEQFMQSHSEEALRLAADWLNIDIAVLRPMWAGSEFRVNLSQSQLVAMEGEARWAMSRAYVKRQPVHNFLANVYLDALLATQPDRVTFIR